jgi:hypothetical protein
MTRKFTFLLLTTFVLSSQLFAAIEDINYYPTQLIELKSKLEVTKDSVKLQDGLRELLYQSLSKVHLVEANKRDGLYTKCPDLRSENQKCVEQRRDISYRQARRYLFGELHLRRNYRGHFVTDKYCEEQIGEYAGIGPGQIPDHNIMNCEHTWPQSKFSRRHSRGLQKTDLHHLYPVYSRANSSRGNLPFAEVSNDRNSICEASRRGPAHNTGVTSFEPPTEHKGNVARALFYFSVRYQIEISDGQEEYLRKWHQIDPVDEEELIRNQRIYEIQGNRNPFIDDEGLVTFLKDF